ncbi:unnamed protein product [Malus baccata var. baccata]
MRLHLLLFICITTTVLLFSAAEDYETSTFHSIADGETLVSTGGTFELGFFIPDSSENRYVGIWYKKISVGRVLITLVTHSYRIRSDVYSFGVMVLEIVNGKRNKGFSHPGDSLNLLGHAILMLSGESALSQPQKPGFYSERDLEDLKVDPCANKARAFSANEVTFTINAKYSESNAKKMRIIISTTVLSTGLLILGLALLFYVWKKKHQKGGKLERSQKEDLELPLFDLMTIVSATNNFSIENKLGEGGFGSVFKAWILHTEGRPLELLDTSVEDSITLLEVVRTIHVGLLCVQRNPEDRPSMSAVVLMLSGEGTLPQPLKPGFYSERDLTELEASHSSKACSANEVTISVLEAR